MSEHWPAGPSRPLAPAAEVHVWRAELEAAGWPAAAGLPAAERERARKLLRPGSGARWVASRWALRGVLGRYLETDPAAIALRLGANGKPELAEGPERLSFNLSHSDSLALVAVTVGREVGVDVERIDGGQDPLALAERALEPPAAAAVRAAAPADRTDVFFQEWARHEALLKCHGGGLGNPPPPHPVAVSSLDVGRGYAAALAVPGRQAPVYRRYSLPPG